jgi:hypothetical protein
VELSKYVANELNNPKEARMLLVSDRPLIHRQIERPACVPFEEEDIVVAEDLISRGVARKSLPPAILYMYPEGRR